MRKIIKFLRRLWERYKDRHGKYLVLYLDRDNDVRHRFQYADEDRAKESYLILQKMAKGCQNGDILVQMFENGYIVRHYQTKAPTMHLRNEVNALCIK